MTFICNQPIPSLYPQLPPYLTHTAKPIFLLPYIILGTGNQTTRDHPYSQSLPEVFKLDSSPLLTLTCLSCRNPNIKALASTFSLLLSSATWLKPGASPWPWITCRKSLSTACEYNIHGFPKPLLYLFHSWVTIKHRRKLYF